MRKGLAVVCAVALFGLFAMSNMAEGEPRALQVDGGCVDTLRVFGVKFTDAQTSSEFTASYLSFKVSPNAAGDCTVHVFYNGSSVWKAGGIIFEATEAYATPAGMFWMADSMYVMKNDTTDLFCWEASKQ